MMCSDIVACLRLCELFGQLDEDEVEKLAGTLIQSCRIDEYKGGDIIFAQGDYGTRLYIISEGQILLQRTFDLGGRTARKPVALLGKGRAMGWTSLLFGTREATVSAVCQKPALIMSVDGTALRSALDAEPAIGFKVMDRLACMLGDRLRAAYSAFDTQL